LKVEFYVTIYVQRDRNEIVGDNSIDRESAVREPVYAPICGATLLRERPFDTSVSYT
jgi:hypothetical protein